MEQTTRKEKEIKTEKAKRNECSDDTTERNFGFGFEKRRTSVSLEASFRNICSEQKKRNKCRFVYQF